MKKNRKHILRQLIFFYDHYEKIKVIFYGLWTFSFLVGFVEVFTYKGFFLKHINIDLTFVYYLAFIFGLILQLTYIGKGSFLSKKIQKIISYFLWIISFVFFLFLYLEQVSYPNFVFSKFHINPDNLFWPWMMSFYLVFVGKIKLEYFRKIFYSPLLLLIIVMWALSLNLIRIRLMFTENLRYLIKNPLASYDEKMRHSVGQKFYDYTLFINKYTPEDSNILIPPMAFPWPQSGNGAYLRYFIHPRNFANSEEYLLGKDKYIKDFDYVLLDWGESDGLQDQYTQGWPKFDIPAEEIIFWQENGDVEIVKEDYVYNKYKGKEVWGLIKVKK